MTQCSFATATIKNIKYKDPFDDRLNEGDLAVSVTSSQYNATSLRNAMIDSAALTAMQSATGNNCYTETYEGQPTKDRRSFYDLARRWLGLQERDTKSAYWKSETMCKASSFAGVQYLPEYWRQADSPSTEFMWLESEWKFEANPQEQFDCEFLAGLVDAFVAVQPEFAAAEVELGDAIAAICTGVMEHTVNQS